MSFFRGSAEIGGREGTGGHTVDRWKRKEAIKTIAGYVQALSLLGLAAVESLKNNPSHILAYEHTDISNNISEAPTKGMQPQLLTFSASQLQS